MLLEELRLLEALSFFRGGISQEAARAVAGSSLGQLWSMVSKGLLRRVGAGRFELHRLVQQFVEEQLAQQPERQQNQGSAYLVYWVEQLRPLRSRARQPAVLQWLERE